MAEGTKKVKTSQVLSTTWRKYKMGYASLKEFIETTNMFLAKLEHTIRVTFDAECDSAYTTIVGKDKNVRLIKLGGRLIQQIVGLPNEVSKEAFFKELKHVIITIIGLNYHEMGHNLHTDMASRLIVDYPKPQYRNFMHQVFNIEEDYVVEEDVDADIHLMSPDKPRPKQFFGYIKSQLFDKQAAEYEDKGDVSSFLNYLLLLVRVGKKKITGTNAVFEKYKDELVPKFSDILAEPDPTTRLEKVVKFCEWCIDNIEELDFATADPPKEKKSGSTPGDGPIIEKGKGGGRTDKRITPKFTDDDSDEDGKDKDGDETSTEPDIDDSEAAIDVDADFDSEILTAADHTWIIAKDEYIVRDPSVVDKIDDIIHDMGGAITDIEHIMRLFKARKGPRDVYGYKHGSLDLRTGVQKIMQGRARYDLNIFKQIKLRGKIHSIATVLVEDLSGSMGDDKSHICTCGVLTMTEVCDQSHIPCQVCGFTKDRDGHLGGNITIVMKDFDESFAEAKPYLAVGDRQLLKKLESVRYIPTFCGNTEEINLFYIGQELKKRPEEIKLMFVFCDGATTGDSTQLAKTIEQLEQDGIIVIGIGVCSNLEGLYSKTKMFRSITDLQEGLADYLVEKLSEYALQ